MNAIEYFKKHGFNKSKIHLDIMNAENWHNGFYNDLKRLVESWELVESYGGIDQSKKAIIDGNNHCMFIDLEKAIEDVEKCQ